MSMGNYDRQTDQPTGPPIVEFHLQDECIYGAVLYKVMEVWLLLIMTNRPTDPPNQKRRWIVKGLHFLHFPLGVIIAVKKKRTTFLFASSPCQVNEANEDPKPRRQHNYLTPPHSGPQLSRRVSWHKLAGAGGASSVYPINSSSSSWKLEIAYIKETYSLLVYLMCAASDNGVEIPRIQYSWEIP